MATVLVPLATGFEEIEAVNLINIMRRGGIDVDIAYLGGEFTSDLVTGANGIVVQAQIDINLVSSDDYDMIVLPGGHEGTNRLAANNRVQELLKEFKLKDKWIGAICAAPFALHKAGVLNHNYTCYPSTQDKIRYEGYTDKEKVVTDGKVMTSRGPGTAICFGLEIIKTLVGNETYEGVKKGTLSDFC
ncbi:MAG: DJ-1 family glyoxalase III [Sulfurovaceae bacterium]|nr:DJ-1/PfpI family protein [Sulfurovaceae bacterium]